MGRAVRAAGRPAGGGQRGASRDLAVRLHYAGVDHRHEPDPVAAIAAAGAPSVDVVANYTSFQALRTRLRVMAGRESTVTIALLFPDLLGTYGDSGNAVILAQRLRWRGIGAEVVTVRAGDPVPAGCELYVVGGGEDLPQALAARQLGARLDRPLGRAVDGGAAVLAVCAGLQILGTSFVGPDGVQADGLGLVDCVTRRGTGRRAVGEIVVEPVAGLGLPPLTGYENHAGVTSLGPGAAPAGRVRYGVGNGDGSGTDGRLGRPGVRDLPARPGPGPQPGAGRSAARLGGRRAGPARRPARNRACGPSAWPRPGGRRSRPGARPCGGDCGASRR